MMIGARLSHYEITAKLGEGGMGAVYRATDTKLGRDVAIKVLPEAFTEDADRLARFEREARVLAALEHPNIAGIYEVGSGQLAEPAGEGAPEDAGSGEAPGPRSTTVHYLAMQLAQGETLAARLERGPMRLEEALGVARQIAEALEAAHERGIVHRDLKPANVVLAPDGTVKVLDFGLAKAWDQGPASDLTQSPTLTARMTQAGIILGTAGYMSPEQARGQEADRRSDIWSFGVVLWEMLTGARLFAADTVSDTLARVLMAEPDWDEIEAELPAPISHLLARCLERTAKLRLQAIGEARIAIDDYLADPAAGKAVPIIPSDSRTEPAGGSRLRRAVPWALLGLVLVAALAAGARWWRGPSESAEILRYTIQPPPGTPIPTQDIHGLDISRDGRKIAFVVAAGGGAESMIYLKTTEDAEARPLPGTEGGRVPFFSPDGEWLGFFTERELRKISLQGGMPQVLAQASDRRGAVWHPDGSIYFVPNSTGPIMRIPSTGGPATPVTKLDQARNERTHRWPALTPDGRGLIYTSDTFATTEFYDDARIELVDLESGGQKVLLEGSSRALFSPSGRLLFARDGAVYATAFDAAKREVVGNPVLAVPEVATIVVSGAVELAVSANGTLTYVPGGKTSDAFDVVWVGPNGETTPAYGETARYFQVALSPSETQAIVSTTDQGATDLWLLDLERNTLTRLTFAGTNTDPVWTPDGESVIFASSRDGRSERPYRKAADGSGAAELVWDAPRQALPLDVSPDGRWLAVSVLQDADASDASSDLWMIDLTGEEEPYAFLDDEANTDQATFSPDGRWLAYSSDETDSSQRIYVRPFPPAPGKWQVSTTGSREARWTKDGKRLYYRTVRGMRYVPVDTSEGFRIGREVVFEEGTMGPPYDMVYGLAGDGNRFLTTRPHLEEAKAWRVFVVQNWTHELEGLFER